jgi:uncharacterized protein
MQRSDLVLAVLSTSGGEAWTPVQVQKVFFLLDRKIPSGIGGPKWDFAAYDYGPFDSDVYREIEALEKDGLAVVEGLRFSKGRTFRLTSQGQDRGKTMLGQLPGNVSDYIARLSSWLRGLSFQELVSAVYREFPEMKKNSVFQE